jgi:hypothetical protein
MVIGATTPRLTLECWKATSMADADSKRCGKCAEQKPLSLFYKNGRAGYCIPCEKAYKRLHYLNNAETIKARARAWTADNPERKRDADAAYRKANRSAVAAKALDWCAKNKDKRKAVYTASRQNNLAAYQAREKAYRDASRAECNARIKAWKRANPDRALFSTQKRRAQELRAVPAWVNLDAVGAIYAKARAMGGGAVVHVDHIVPLISPIVCGLHCEANLQIVPAADNLKKNNRWWPDMP